MEQEVKKLRAETLKKWKVKRLAILADKKDTLTERFNEEYLKLDELKKETLATKFIPMNEGDCSIY